MTTNFIGESDTQSLEIKLLNMENKLPIFEDQLASLDTGFSRQVSSITNRLNDLEREIGELQEKISL